MCGLAVIYSYKIDGKPIDKGELRRISDRMNSRGPDGKGEWFSDNNKIGFAHRRLAILDLSPAGSQPMQLRNSDETLKLVITYNGEIYNFKALQDELIAEGRRFKSNSDTEVLLHLYDRDGPDMVSKLRGMFAIAIWDIANQALFLARDSFGIKPLYYSDNGNTIRVASQVKALVAGGNIDTSPTPAGHAGFFIFGYVPEPHTLFNGIKALEAGSTLWIKYGEKAIIKKYFDVRSLLSIERINLSRTETQVRLYEALSDSVAKHLVSDVTVGVFLSAGLDSATITALASEHTNTNLKSMTLQFEELVGSSMDEAPLAEKISMLYNTSHQTRNLKGSEFHEEMDTLFKSMDQPSVDGVNTYFVSKEASSIGLKVALSGVGGDELFGGYPSFQQIPQLANSIGWIPGISQFGKVARYISAPILRTITSPKYASLFEFGGSYSGAYLLRRGLYLPWELPNVMDPDFAKAGWEALQPLIKLEQTIEGILDEKAKVSALEMTWYMKNQLLRDADWAGMAHSLEIRTPFIDTNLFKQIAKLKVTKRDMATSPKKSLPIDVLNRPKSGFHVPVREWLAGKDQSFSNERGLRGWARRVYSETTKNTA